mmetsp:Transcript_54947/g.154568  ORF Transcript_54947/g.154568 Transcript_54947/m.154568 type:complete len:282 (+) Transcript_54947:122-967(+)
MLRQFRRFSTGRRVAVIHAMQPSIASCLPAFERLWPEAELVHLLDDSLARDVAPPGGGHPSAAGAGSPALGGTGTGGMTARFIALARYAKEGAGCDGIVFSCSAFGSHIEEVQRQLRTESFPVLKPNEAMMREAVQLALGPRAGGSAGSRPRPVAVFSMFEPSLPSITRELQDVAAREDAAAGPLDLRPYYVPEALQRLNSGDEEGCIRAIADFVCGTVRALEEHEQERHNPLACCVFAMFSMARARGAAEELLAGATRTAPPVLTSPDSAVLQIKAQLGC